MSEGAPAVGIIMGSQSDWSTLRHAADTLDVLSVPYETRIVSAHRTPERLVDYASSARDRGLKVIIAGAGMAKQFFGAGQIRGHAGRQPARICRHDAGHAPSPSEAMDRPACFGAGRSAWAPRTAVSLVLKSSLNGADFGPFMSTFNNICSPVARRSPVSS